MKNDSSTYSFETTNKKTKIIPAGDDGKKAKDILDNEDSLPLLGSNKSGKVSRPSQLAIPLLVDHKYSTQSPDRFNKKNANNIQDDIRSNSQHVKRRRLDSSSPSYPVRKSPRTPSPYREGILPTSNFEKREAHTSKETSLVDRYSLHPCHPDMVDDNRRKKYRSVIVPRISPSKSSVSSSHNPSQLRSTIQLKPMPNSPGIDSRLRDVKENRDSYYLHRSKRSRTKSPPSHPQLLLSIPSSSKYSDKSSKSRQYAGSYSSRSSQLSAKSSRRSMTPPYMRDAPPPPRSSLANYSTHRSSRYQSPSSSHRDYRDRVSSSKMVSSSSSSKYRNESPPKTPPLYSSSRYSSRYGSPRGSPIRSSAYGSNSSSRARDRERDRDLKDSKRTDYRESSHKERTRDHASPYHHASSSSAHSFKRDKHRASSPVGSGHSPPPRESSPYGGYRRSRYETGSSSRKSRTPPSRVYSKNSREKDESLEKTATRATVNSHPLLNSKFSSNSLASELMEKMRMKKLSLGNDLIKSPASSMINTSNSESNDAKALIQSSSKTEEAAANGTNLTSNISAEGADANATTSATEPSKPAPVYPRPIIKGKTPVEVGLPIVPVRSIECFKILEQIGEGTYGQVYKAKDTDNWYNFCYL